MNESAEVSVNESTPNSTKTPLWRNIVFLFGILVFCYMLYAIGVDQIMDHIRSARYWFVPIVGIWGIVYLMNALSWHAIIKVIEPASNIPFYQVLKFTVSGFGLNYITPFGLAGGEPYRIMELRRYMKTEHATASVILHVMMHICSHFFFWLTAVLLISWLVPVSTSVSMVLSGIVVVCCGVIFLFFRGYKNGLVVRLFAIFERLPIIGQKVTNMDPARRAKLVLIDQHITNLHGKQARTFYFALTMEYLARMINSLEILFILMALGVGATYFDSVIVVALSSLFANILFLSPMQLGTREGGMMLAFSTIGLISSIGISVSLITRIRELFWIFMGFVLLKIDLHKSTNR